MEKFAVISEVTDQTGFEQVTALLQKGRKGDREAFDRLFPLVYDELRRMARYQFQSERAGHTLLPTALVHEAYLKLAGQPAVDWQSRAHFFSIAARAMRQILVDHARKRKAEKRGARDKTTVTSKRLALNVPLEELLALDEALGRLDGIDKRLRKVVELNFFGGLTEREIAEVLGVSQKTVQRDWTRARAWLYRELYPEKSA